MTAKLLPDDVIYSRIWESAGTRHRPRSEGPPALFREGEGHHPKKFLYSDPPNLQQFVAKTDTSAKD